VLSVVRALRAVELAQAPVLPPEPVRVQAQAPVPLPEPRRVQAVELPRARLPPELVLPLAAEPGSESAVLGAAHMDCSWSTS